MQALLLMIVAAVIVFAVALNKQFSSKDAPMINQEALSLAEKLEVLSSAGIQLKPEFSTEQLINTWGQEQLEQPGFELLLSAMGATEEQEPWRYLSDSVWHFDTEAIEDHGDYIRIAERMVELAGGSLPLENIRDYVDLEEEKAWLSFSFLGEAQRIDLTVNDDWVDGNVFDQLARLLSQSDSNKLFVYYDLGGQDLIIACLSKEALEMLNGRGLVFNPL